MTLDYKPSTPHPPNYGELIDSDDETETTGKLLEEYYKSRIYHNYPNFHMIQEIVKEEHRYLRASINLFNKSKRPYS